MKKIIIFCLTSVFVVFTSLYYVNFVLLVDSSVISNKPIVNKEYSEERIAVIPKGYSSSDFNNTYDKLVLLNKNLVYLIDLNSSKSSILKELSFVEDISFLDSDNLLYVTKNTNSITIKKYSISEKNIEVLGDLSFKYFTRLNNVTYEDDSIYFDVEYLKDGINGSKSYVFKNGRISSSSKTTSILKKLNVNDSVIYTTDSGVTYINNSIFQYSGSSNFELLGVDKENIVYLIDKTNSGTIISLSVSDTINILESYNLGEITYKEIMCTDNVYIIEDDFVYNLKENNLTPFNEGHILLIVNNVIYYEKDGEILYKSIIGG